MIRIIRIRFSIIREDGKVACFCDPGPGSLFGALEIAGGEDLLVVRCPPVWSAGGTDDEFVSVVDDDEGV